MRIVGRIEITALPGERPPSAHHAEIIRSGTRHQDSLVRLQRQNIVRILQQNGRLLDGDTGKFRMGRAPNNISPHS